jgi:Family of unknown function (DUF6262)
VTTQPTNPLLAARRNDSDRRRRKVLDALDRLRTAGDEITVSAVACTAGVDRSFLYRHHDLRSQILALAAEPEPNPSGTRTSHRSLLADLANLRAHNERLRHHNTKLSEQLLDRRQDLQDRDDELAAARAANRDLMTRLNGRAPNNKQPCPTPVVHTT